MLQLDAGDLREQHARQMRARAWAKRRISELSGPRLGVVDEIAHRLVRRVRRHHQHVLRGRDQHDRLKVAHRIEALVRRDGDVDGERLRAEVQRVAIRRRLGGGRGAEIAAGAGAVLDHDGLAPFIRQLAGQDAPERVDRSASRESDHEPHGLVGIGLGGCGKDRSDRGRRDGQCAD